MTGTQWLGPEEPASAEAFPPLDRRSPNGRRPPPLEDEPTTVLPRVPVPDPRPVGGFESATVELPQLQPSMSPVASRHADHDTPVHSEATRTEGENSANSNGSVALNSAAMAAGSLASRITGLLRNSMLVAALGNGLVGDAYTVANTLPNMVYELLLGGVLSSVLIPMLVRARTHDTDHGEAYAQRLLTLAMVLLGGATMLAVVCAPLLSSLFNGSHASQEGEHLRTVLSYLLLPEIFFYGMAALIAAVLNTRAHFAAPMWTPILNNAVVIVTCVMFMALPSPHDRTLGPLSTAQVLVLGVGTTLGIVAQAIGLLPALRRTGFRWRVRWDFHQLHLRELGRISVWMLCYVAVSQLGVIVVVKLAQLAADRGGFGPIVFNNGFLVFMMAHGIVAVSIMTALMPRMSAAAAERRFTDLADQLSLGTRLSSVILIPATAAYIALGRPLAVVLFGYGAYRHAAADTGFVIAVAGLGLVPFAISQLQIFAFYSMPDTRTPALLNVPVVVVRSLVDVLLYFGLAPAMVAAGLMVGNAVSYVLAVVIGYWLLRRRIGRLGLRTIASTLSRLTLAGGVAAVPAWLITIGLRSAMGVGRVSSLLQLTIGGCVLLAGYAGLALLLRVSEIREFAGTLIHKLGR